jgi:hypothetical protein
MWLIDVSFIPMLDMSESDSNTVLWFEEITQRTSLVDRLQTHSVRVIEEMGARPPAIWTTFHLSTIFIQPRKRPLVAWSPATGFSSRAWPTDSSLGRPVRATPLPACILCTIRRIIVPYAHKRHATPRGTACDHRASLLARCHFFATLCGCDRWLQILSPNPHQ